MPCGQYAGAGTDHRGFGRCSQHGGNTERGKRLAFIEKCAADAVHEAVEEQGGLEIENALGQLYGIVAEITPDKALEAELWRTNGAVLQIQDLIQRVGPGELEMLPHGRVLKDLYEKERDRLVKISKIMIDIGFAEREVAASEVFAGTMQAVIMAVLEGLQLTPDQSTLAPQVIRRVLEIEAARLDPATVVDAVVTNRQFVDDEEPMPQAQGKRVHVPPPDPIDEADEI